MPTKRLALINELLELGIVFADLDGFVRYSKNKFSKYQFDLNRAEEIQCLFNIRLLIIPVAESLAEKIKELEIKAMLLSGDMELCRFLNQERDDTQEIANLFRKGPEK